MKLKLLAAFLFSSFAATLTAQNCAPGWMYYRNILVDNTANANPLVDYQVRVMMNTALLISQGKLNTDGSDLRFTDNSSCTPLHFYMDSLNPVAFTHIWVKIPFVAANSVGVIDVYYGNPSATVSPANGDSTFLFFDDFEDASIDVSKWDTVGSFSAWTESGGSMDYASTPFASSSRWKYVRSTMSFSSPVFAEFGLDQDYNNAIFGFASTDNVLDRYMFRALSPVNDTLRIIHFNDTTSNGVYIPGTYDFPFFRVPFNLPNNYRVHAGINGSSNLEFSEFSFIDSSRVNSTNWPLNTITMTGWHFCLSTLGNTDAASCQYIKVRRGEYGNPITSVLSEGTLTGVEAIDPFAGITISPNPSNGEFSVDLSVSAQMQLRMTDMTGRVVYTSTLAGGQRHSLAPGVPAGVYFVTFISRNQTSTKKVVIK
jgi:hypothetical protein